MRFLFRMMVEPEPDVLKAPKEQRKNLIKTKGLRVIGIIKLALLVSATLSVTTVSAKSSTAKSKLKKLPSLGRPFLLGDLYDVKTDQIIKGPKLWNSYHLQNFSRTLQPSSGFKVSSSESIDDKANDFDLSVELKLTFMSGRVEVNGAAGYLHHKLSNSLQASVSLKYKTETWFEEFAPEVFTKVDYPDVLKNAPATHVVTAMQYGASAVFVFQKTVKEESEKRTVSGSMGIAVRTMPSIQIEGSGRLNISEDNRKKTEDFRCEFYGDFILPEHPGTFDDAVKVYKKLPTYLGEEYENSVPLEVFLFPLDQMPIERASEILHEIRNELVNEVSVVMNHLDSIHIKANDIIESDFADFHERLRRNAEKFQSYVDTFKLLIQQQLTRILPHIREHGNEAELAKMLKNITNTAFNKKNLDLWIEEARKEFLVLSATHDYPNYCADDAQVTAKLMGGVPFSVVLTMRLQEMGVDDEYLRAMKKYLDKTTTTVLRENYTHKAKNQWWKQNRLIRRLESGSEFLKKIVELKKRQKEENFEFISKVQILTVEEPLDRGENASVRLRLYHKAKLVDDDFIPPSVPGRPRLVKARFGSLTIEWSAPADPKNYVKGYSVESWLLTQNGTDKIEKMNKTKEPRVLIKDQTANVSNLIPHSGYAFRIVVVTKLGKTTESETSDVFYTVDCPKGTSRSDKKCHPCTPGHYSDIKGATDCMKCPLGSYSTSFRSKACVPCPENKTTIVPGSKYAEDCVQDGDNKLKNSLDEFTKKMGGEVAKVKSQVDTLKTSMGKKIDNKIAKLEKKVDSFYNVKGDGCCVADNCEDYRGHKDETKSGRTCQAWSSHNPHEPRKELTKLESNYCRNPTPDENEQAWCYTTDEGKRWEACDIPKCSVSSPLDQFQSEVH